MSAPERPAVSVVVPVLGDAAEARVLVAALERLDRRPDDEVIVVDNSPEHVLAGLETPAGIRVCSAPVQASSYYARNVGAEHARNAWLLFVDADCEPEADLLNAYFAPTPGARTGAVAGWVLARGDGSMALVRYACSRRHLDPAVGRESSFKPSAVTANLLVRRAAWEAVGGFLEGIRSGGDSDFCWRMQDAGWALEFREQATVHHRQRDRLPALLRQTARYAASRRWLRARHPGSFPRERPVRGVPRALLAAVRWAATGQLERARMRAIDAAVMASEAVGAHSANVTPAVRRPIGPGGDIVVLVDAFPELSETFIVAEVRALSKLGLAVRVEALVRARRPDRAAGRELTVTYAEDDGPMQRLLDLGRLACRHPVRCAGDLAARRRWRAEEPVAPLRTVAPLARRLHRGDERRVHAHFAKGAALTALRLHRLCGVPYSVTAHAYDIYREPSNLTEKLHHADIVTSGCAYTVADLRQIAGPEHAGRVHEIVMGVDGARFRRRTDQHAGHHVLAVGRLVEKKGFEHLVRATALVHGRGVPIAVTIVGDGPLREPLAALIEELGLGDVVTLAGAREQEHVRELLEETDVLAMPCVVAGDGDRDSMPVVVKEALAMEVPVVASDEVGLPEVVMPEWGRLVAPGEPEPLADALAELLSLDAPRRAAMGRAGRAFVLEHCDVAREAARLAGLLGLDQRTSMR